MSIRTTIIGHLATHPWQSASEIAQSTGLELSNVAATVYKMRRTAVPQVIVSTTRAGVRGGMIYGLPGTQE